MAKEKFIIEPHFRLQEWVAEEKGYFKDEGLDYDVPRAGAVDATARTTTRATRSARCSRFEARPQVGRQLRLPLDGERRRLQGPRQALWRRLLGLDRAASSCRRIPR